MVTGCVSSRFVHECEGEAECGFYGLPHVLCVPVPPYAQAHAANADAAQAARAETASSPALAVRENS